MFSLIPTKICSYVIVISIGYLAACQTLNNDADDKQREQELLATQKTVIVDYLNQGLPTMALKDLRPLQRQHPKDADLKNLLGLTHLSMKNPKAALTHFEEAYRLQPRAAIALNLSSAYIETKQYSRAIKILRELKASEEGKNYQFPERISHNIAFAAEKMNKLTAAEKYYKAALQENPSYYLSLMRLGQIFERRKQEDKALQQFHKAREACLKCFDPIQAVVKLEVKKGNGAMAVKVLREYLGNKEVGSEDRMKAKQLIISASQKQNHPQASHQQSRPTQTRRQ